MSIPTFIAQGFSYGAWALAAVILLGVLMLAAALPLMAWIEASRMLLWPVITKARSTRRPTQFGLVDLSCLLVEMSLLGVLCGRLAVEPAGGPLAILVVLILSAAILSTWRLSVRWLSRTRVRQVVPRAVFQLFVVPTAIFFPILFGSLAAILYRLLPDELFYELETTKTANAVLIAAMATLVSMRATRQLAIWVAASTGSE